MSKQALWNANQTSEEKLRYIYTFINHLLFEMDDGKVQTMLRPLSISFVKMAEKGDIDEVTANENASMFLYWQPNTEYKVNDLRNDEDGLYKCLQGHVSQSGWEPHLAPALWKKCGYDEETGIIEWSQPISSADAYMLGDEVMYNGVHYKSTINNNVWSPEAYPQGWEVV